MGWFIDKVLGVKQAVHDAWLFVSNAIVDFALNTLRLEEIVSFTVENNIKISSCKEKNRHAT